MQNLMDDKTVLMIFKILFKEFKSGLKDGKYFIFLPYDIEILGKGNVKIKAKKNAENLRDGLKQLGITLYHLKTGESEHNNDSYRMDGYKKEFQSELTPALRLMLSGEACDITQVEKMMSSVEHEITFGKAKKNFKEACAKTVSFVSAVFKKIINLFSFIDINGSPFGTFLGILFTIIFCIALWKYISFNLAFSDGKGMFIFTLIFMIAAICAFIAWCSRDFNNKEYIFFAIIITFLYASTSFLTFFTTSSEGRSGKTPVDNYSVLISRGTGEFFARLPIEDKDEDGVDLVYRKFYVNHFKYKVIPGIPFTDSIAVINELKNDGFALSYYKKIKYQVIPEEYGPALKKWKSNSKIAEEIQKISIEITREMNNYFGLITKSMSKEDLVINFLAKSDSPRPIDVQLNKKFDEELAKYKLPHLILSAN